MTAPKMARSTGRGRYYAVPNEDGKVVDLPSVTTLIDQMSHPGLDRWKLKTVAAVFNERPDLVALAGVDPWAATQQALDANRSAANYGTAIHGYTESADARVLDLALVPDSIRAQMLAYVETRKAVAWEIVESEVTTYNHAAGYAGTLDRILRFPNRPDWGAVVADIKTGKAVYEDVAIQMGMYANAEGIYTGFEFRPLPDDLNRETGVVIHVRPEGCTLHLIDLRAGWRAGMALARYRRDWLDAKPRVGPAITNDDALYVASAPDAEGGPVLAVAPTAPDAEAEAVAKVTAAFPGSEVVDLTPRTSEAVRVALADRLRRLDRDLLAEVASHVRTNRVPKMSDPSFGPEHAREYEIALDIAEHAQNQRSLRNV